MSGFFRNTLAGEAVLQVVTLRILVWLYDLSRQKESCFVPYIADALENEVFK